EAFTAGAPEPIISHCQVAAIPSGAGDTYLGHNTQTAHMAERTAIFAFLVEVEWTAADFRRRHRHADGTRDDELIPQGKGFSAPPVLPCAQCRVLAVDLLDHFPLVRVVEPDGKFPGRILKSQRLGRRQSFAAGGQPLEKDCVVAISGLV